MALMTNTDFGNWDVGSDLSWEECAGIPDEGIESVLFAGGAAVRGLLEAETEGTD